MIHVTKTYLPKRESLDQYIDQIYQSNWVTNNGSLVKLLEKRLAEYLGVKNIVLVSNGTIALEIAYRVLGLRGFVITTPFSFVATTSSLVTNGLLPIFADINPRTFNIDTTKIEQLITPNTSAILPSSITGHRSPPTTFAKSLTEWAKPISNMPICTGTRVLRAA